VQVGDTWKKTVSYQPQRLQGAGGRQAVQRLDYTYTYNGLVQSNGKTVHRVTGETSIDTDLAEFLNQMFEMTPQQTGLKAIPLKMKAKVEFDLDQKTKQTLLAVGETEGSYSFQVTVLPDPIREERLKGRSVMRLVANTRAAAAPAARPATGQRPPGRG
jgi:hypothetical protein